MITETRLSRALPQNRSAITYALVAFFLAVVNASVFPSWTGYTGGAKPMPPGPGPICPYFALLVLNAALLIFLSLNSDWKPPLSLLFLLVIFTRLAYLVTRSLHKSFIVDQDVALYFAYGREIVAGNFPLMEYPQGALLLFAEAFKLAGGRLVNFRSVFPLSTLPFELITVGTLVWLGKHHSSERIAYSLTTLYAVSPFTLVFWYSKYDVVPAALLALGVALFSASRFASSALVLALGFLTKWLPGIAIPFFAAHLFLTARWCEGAKYVLIAVATIALPLAFFWQVSPEKFFHTYDFQSQRSLTGESLLYLPVYFLDPGGRLRADIGPWGDSTSTLISNDAATLLLLAGETALFIILILSRRWRESSITLGCLGVAAFLILNRVFSPQFVIELFVAYAICLLALHPRRILAFLSVLTILVLTFLNFLVWPLWSEPWLLASFLFFALNIALIGSLVYLTAKRSAAGSAREVASPRQASAQTVD